MHVIMDTVVLKECILKYFILDKIHAIYVTLM